MLTGENISALHGNTGMSSKLVITSQEKDIEIFVNKDENTLILVIESALAPQNKGWNRSRKNTEKDTEGLHSNKTGMLKGICLEKSKIY